VENLLLTDTQTRQNVFKQGIIANLAYWLAWVQHNQANFTAVDHEYPHIVRALLFALDVEQATWTNSHLLIMDFSPYMERRGHWQVWLNVLNRAIQVAHRLTDPATAIPLSLLSARLLHWQARFTEAKQAYRQVIRLARHIDDDFNRARVYSNLGFLYTEQGYLWRAEILSRHALCIFEQLDSNHGRAHTENHLGILYTRQGHFELAQQHFERACTLWQTMSDDHGLMRGYINFGMLYLYKDEPATARVYLQKALDQAQLLGEKVEIGLIFLNIGVAYQQQNDQIQAEAYARQALTICKQVSNSKGVALALGSLGFTYLKQSRWPEALSSFHTALEIWREVESKPGELSSLIHILAYEVERENWPQAAAQLAEVERLMLEYGHDAQYPMWRTLLAECRQRLKEGLQGS
jgi:tetratricopeptide (TPR) repeat protein